MKRHIKLLALILSVMFIFPLVGCEDVDLDEEVKDGTDIEISTPNYGFVKAEEFVPNDENPLEGTVKYFPNDEKFEVGTTYYLIITFTVTPRQNNSGQTYFKASARFDNLDVLDAVMQQASTSATSAKIEHDMIEDKITRNVQASFRISESTTDVQAYTMIVRMVPNKPSDNLGVEIKIDFSLDEGSAYRIWGAFEGFSQRVTIGKGKLATPVVTYNYGNMHLEWKHVKNASYYVVYDNGEPVLFTIGGKLTNKIVATNIRAGDKIEANLDLSNLITGYKELTVVAYPENGELDECFAKSESSQIVEIDW